MDDLFNAAWNNIGLTSDSADWLLSDGTDAKGQYEVNTPAPASGSSDSWLGSIWDTITGTASKVVDYWGAGVVASNAPEYQVSARNPTPYAQPPVDQEAAQAQGFGVSNTWLVAGGVLAAVAVVALFARN